MADCWLEYDGHDEGDAALCVGTEHGVDVYAPIVISDAHGTPKRQSVDVYYREPFLGMAILLGTVSVPEDVTLAEAIKGYVVNNFEAATRVPERLEDKGWALTDLDSMQMQRDRGDRIFEMYEVTSGWDGASWAYEHATFCIDDFSPESLEMAVDGYYDKGQDATRLSGLAEACGRRCAAFGDDDYPYGILAEIVFECGLCDKTTSASYATREAAVATVVSRVLDDVLGQDVGMAVVTRHM